MSRYRISLLVAAALLAASPRSFGADTTDARPRDIQRLQEDLANLDVQLASLEAGDRRADDFRTRGEEIKEEAIYVKVAVRKNQAAGREGTGIALSEVQDLQRAIRSLGDDIEKAFGGGSAPGRDVTLAEGTQIQVRLDTGLSSKTARLEDRFEASVVEPVQQGEDLVIPAGSRVRGVVKGVEPAHLPAQSGRLDLQFDALFLDEQRLDIVGSVSSVGQQKTSDTAKKAGIGAVLGGVLGGLLGGKDGAIVGVVLGGGGAVAGTKGKDVELPAGTVLTVRLDRPLTLPRD